jgi:cobalt-zinc-cadmium resistance protein CzcA
MLHRVAGRAALVLMALASAVHAQTLTLPQALEEAVRNNPVLRKARASVLATGAAFWESVSPEDPEAFVEWEGIPETSRTFSDFQVRKIGIIQKVEFPISYLYRGKLSRWREAEARAFHALRKREIIRDVKKAYWRLVMFYRQLEFLSEMNRLTRDTYEKARIRVLTGESSPYDTLKARVDLTRVSRMLINLKQERDTARDRLAVLLGRKNGEPAIPAVAGFRMDSVRITLDTARERALENHPRLNMEEAVIKQRSMERSLAWFRLLPAFTLKYFHMDMDGGSLPGAWGGEFGVSIPLWGLLGGQGRIRSAGFRVEESRFYYEALRQDVILEVKRSFGRWDVAGREVGIYEEGSLRQVDALVNIAVRSYEEGEMSYLEVTDALRSMYQVRIGYMEALYNFKAALADLEFAIGGDIKNFSTKL